MSYSCCDEKRRAAVEAHPTLNGIDWLEVLDSDAPEEHLRQRVLMVRLLKPVPAAFTEKNVRISGGERVRDIGVVWASTATDPPVDKTTSDERDFYAALGEPDHILLVRTDSNGDFSTYRLGLVKGKDDHDPPDDFDPRLVEVAFSFKVECPSDFDCKPSRVCDEEIAPPPDIDYLTKDYAGFRRLMLDRLSRLIPGWRERSAADLGVALPELLAYVADHLSYWQDAVATEAYLETARRRTSLRRHALLVDYFMHEGCNARAWVQVRVNADAVDLAKGGVRFYTRVSGAPDRIAPDTRDEDEALQQGPLVFEPMHDAVLYQAHNEMFFHTWGDTRCCLAQGTVEATLRGHYPDLAAGDVLVFKEVKGPLTGEPEDADPARRHAVRLTLVDATKVDPLTDAPITRIVWHAGDALPFPLCLSSQTDGDHESVLVDDVSTASGNVILADHGRTVEDEDLGSVPVAHLRYPPDRDASHCEAGEPAPIPPRYRPRLVEGPLTRIGHVLKTVVTTGVGTTSPVPFDPEAAAGDAMKWELSRAVPAIVLDSDYEGTTARWEPRRDLLDSEATHLHFVVETEHDRVSRLRLGDDLHGKRPDSGTSFKATYREGNGAAGNVGAAAIAHVVTEDGRIDSVTNPLAARGGTDPESAEQVRRRAPQAFRTQERAVTPDDYGEVTERLGGVQRAAGSLRWTGSWHTVFVTVDREGGQRLSPDHEASVLRHLERYRMAGHDLRVDDPVYVSLEMDMLVCVAQDYFRSNVREALLAVLGSGTLEDGRRGAFHPDNLTFGQTVYLSPIYAAAREVSGVSSVQITLFQRLGQDDPKPLADEFMTLGPLEIARLDNDPNFPEHGVLRLSLHGGK